MTTCSKLACGSTTADRISPFALVSAMSASEYQARAEKDQKTADMLKEYTEKLSGLTYPEWTALREEMNRMFDLEFAKAREKATLTALKTVTGD